MTPALEHIDAMHIVRWALVRAHLHERDRLDRELTRKESVALYASMLSASPRKLTRMLHVDDLALTKRVSKVLRENEQTRR